MSTLRTLPRLLSAGLTALVLSAAGCRAAQSSQAIQTNAPGATQLAPTSRPVASETPEQPPAPSPTLAASLPVYTYRVVNVYPHDPNAFTQGLVYADGVLYESTGGYGGSSLRRVTLETGEVEQIVALDQEYFGEGIALLDNRIVQLTWQSGIGFVYAREGFDLLGEFHYPTEGWGITTDGTRLFMSDGTSTLHILDPETLTETARLDVRAGGVPVQRLNELEWADGSILANIWQSDRIARIDPTTGEVTAWIDLTGLLSGDDQNQEAGVLNGIAYDAAGRRLFVTGKLWPRLFEIELLLSSDSSASPETSGEPGA